MYRDAFYEQLLGKLKGSARRAVAGRGARAAAAVRAARGSTSTSILRGAGREQLQHVHLAQLFAAIGYTEAAARQAAVVPVASARMTCEMRCRLTTGAPGHRTRSTRRGGRSSCRRSRTCCTGRSSAGRSSIPGTCWASAASTACFPPSRTASTTIASTSCSSMVSDIFALYVRIAEAARPPARRTCTRQLSRDLAALAAWWDKFATDEVGLGGRHLRARQRWNRPSTWPPRCGPGTTPAPPPATWPSGGSTWSEFRSPKAYALVIDTLLDHRDPVAAMALLVQWLSQAEEIPLVEEDYLLPRPGAGVDGRPLGRRGREAGRKNRDGGSRAGPD